VLVKNDESVFDFGIIIYEISGNRKYEKKEFSDVV
jgi:hypothetical protein